MKIPHNKDIHSDTSYTANVTIFVAIGTPPDAGLDGTLSVCVTP